MSVALGLPPSEVERTDIAVLYAMREAAATRWTTDTELLAGIYELTHQNMRLLAALAGAKRDEVPPPVRIPRPHHHRHDPEARRTATGGELAAWVRNRRGGST